MFGTRADLPFSYYSEVLTKLNSIKHPKGFLVNNLYLEIRTNNTYNSARLLLNHTKTMLEAALEPCIDEFISVKNNNRRYREMFMEPAFADPSLCLQLSFITGNVGRDTYEALVALEEDGSPIHVGALSFD